MKKEICAQLSLSSHFHNSDLYDSKIVLVKMSNILIFNLIPDFFFPADRRPTLLAVVQRTCSAILKTKECKHTFHMTYFSEALFWMTVTSKPWRSESLYKPENQSSLATNPYLHTNEICLE